MEDLDHEALAPKGAHELTLRVLSSLLSQDYRMAIDSVRSLADLVREHGQVDWAELYDRMAEVWLRHAWRTNRLTQPFIH